MMSAISRPMPAYHCCDSSMGPLLAGGSSEVGSNVSTSSLTTVAVLSGRGVANDRLQGSEASRASAEARGGGCGGVGLHLGNTPEAGAAGPVEGGCSQVRAATAGSWRYGCQATSPLELCAASAAVAPAAGATATAGTAPRISACFERAEPEAQAPNTHPTPHPLPQANIRSLTSDPAANRGKVMPLAVSSYPPSQLPTSSSHPQYRGSGGSTADLPASTSQCWAPPVPRFPAR